MRRALTLGLLAALVLPALAAATTLASGDGTLYVNNADGRVHFLNGFSGVVLGRITSGTLEVVDPDSGCDELATLVWDDDGWRERPLRGARDGVKCVFRPSERTTPMRFRLLQEDEIRVSGTGIWISAVGQGRVTLLGNPGKVRDGTYSLNGARPLSMPETPRALAIGTRTSLP